MGKAWGASLRGQLRGRKKARCLRGAQRPAKATFAWLTPNAWKAVEFYFPEGMLNWWELKGGGARVPGKNILLRL